MDLRSNPSYGDNQLSLQPLPTQTPTYETIPPLTHLMDGIKLELVETKEERHDVNNNRGEDIHKMNSAQMNNKKRESRDQANKSGQMKGKERVTESNGSKDLQVVHHSYANTTSSAELLLDVGALGEEEQIQDLVETGKSSQENETNNRSVKNDKESHGTTSEHDCHQAEDGEKEQGLPKKRATPRAYEVAIPSK